MKAQKIQGSLTTDQKEMMRAMERGLRSADFQSAVSRISNPQTLEGLKHCRLETGDTAG